MGGEWVLEQGRWEGIRGGQEIKQPTVVILQ